MQESEAEERTQLQSPQRQDPPETGLGPAPLYKARAEATPTRKSDEDSVSPAQWRGVGDGGWAPPTFPGKGRGQGLPPRAA